MSVKLGDLWVGIKGDDAQLARDLQKAQQATAKAGKAMADDMKRVGEEMRNVGGLMTLAVTAPVLAGFAKASGAASDLREAVNKATTTFGENTKQIRAFAEEQAEALGLTKKAALEYSATFGLILESSKITGKAAADMSEEMVKLASDLSSFHNIEVNDALEKLRSGLVGETEPLRTLGVQLNEAALKAKALELGVGGASKELSEGQKTALRYAIIMEQTKKAQGDFLRTSDELANQQRQLAASVQNLVAELGEDLLPVAKDLVVIVREAVKDFRALDKETQQNILKAAALAAALGPAIYAIGAVASATGSVIATSAAVKAWYAAHVAGAGAASVATTGLTARMVTLATTVKTAVASSLGSLGLLSVGAGRVLGGVGLALAPSMVGGRVVDSRTGEFLGTKDTPAGTLMSQLSGLDAAGQIEKLSTYFEAFQLLKEKSDFIGPVSDAQRFKAQLTGQIMQVESVRGLYEQWKAGMVKTTEGIDLRDLMNQLSKDVALPKVPAGGNLPGLGSSAPTQELTTAMVRAMGESVKSPGSKAAAACAFFASQVIARFTKGVTDEGGKINWSARGLVQQVKGLGGQTVSASQAMPGALAYKPGSGPSGMHVGVYLGNGQIMDMNGQRDGRRNTRGVTGAKGWTGFINMPDRLMDPKFKGGPVNEDIVKMLQGMERVDDLFQSASQQFHTEMARRNDPRTPIADKFNISLRDFKALMPEAQAQLKGWYDQLQAVAQTDKDAAEGAALFKTFLEGSTAASVQLGESMTKWMGEQDAAMAARAKVQREWLLGIEKQILLSADASEMVKLQFDRENGLGEAAQLTNEEYEERVEALRRLQEHNAELDKSRRFEEALANMVKIRADEQEKAMQAVEAQRGRYLDRLGDMTERLRTLSGVTGEAELKARLLGEGLSQSQADALVSIDMVISRMEEQRAEMQRVANAGAEALKAGFDKLFDGQGVGGFWNGMIESFRGALNQMLAEALAARFRDSLQDLFKINRADLGQAGDAVTRAGIPANIGQIVQGIAGFSASFRGFRAEGGPVAAGAGYVVGERGPEYFVPSSNGRVFNERQMAGAGGPQVVVNITIQASDPRQFEASAGQIQAQIGRTVERALRRNSGR